MHVDDELGLFEAAAQTGVLFPQPLVFLGERVGRGFTAAFLGSQCLQFALFALTAPSRQMGRVESLTAEEGADSAFVPTGFCLIQDGALVLGGEVSALGLSKDLRVGEGDRRGGAGFGRSSATVGLATLALPSEFVNDFETLPRIN